MPNILVSPKRMALHQNKTPMQKVTPNPLKKIKLLLLLGLITTVAVLTTAQDYWAMKVYVSGLSTECLDCGMALEMLSASTLAVLVQVMVLLFFRVFKPRPIIAIPIAAGFFFATCLFLDKQLFVALETVWGTYTHTETWIGAIQLSLLPALATAVIYAFIVYFTIQKYRSSKKQIFSSMQSKLIRKLAFKGDISSLEKLLRTNDRQIINETDNIGHTALFYAIGGEQVAAVKLLLDFGTNPNSKDKKGITPLAFVAEPQPIKEPSAQKRLDMAKLLLQHGADVSIDDHYHNNPLSAAVFHACMGIEDRLPLVELLILHHGDPYHENKSGISPMSFAKKVGWQPVIDILEKK